MVDFTKPCEIDGRPVRILCTDRPHNPLPVVCVRESDGIILARRLDGTGSYGPPIVNTVKKERSFLNIYEASRTGIAGYKDRGQADRMALPDRTAVVEVIYENGKPVDVKLRSVEK